MTPRNARSRHGVWNTGPVVRTTVALLAVLAAACCMRSANCNPYYQPSHRTVAVLDDDRSKAEVEQELSDLKAEQARYDAYAAQSIKDGHWIAADHWRELSSDLDSRIIHCQNVLHAWHTDSPQPWADPAKDTARNAMHGATPTVPTIGVHGAGHTH